MALTLLVAVAVGLIVFDIVAMTVGVDSRDWEENTLREPLQTYR